MEFCLQKKLIIQVALSNRYYQFQQAPPMSFLNAVAMDPHIHLFVLDLPNTHAQQQQIQQRVYHLSKTRRFDDLLSAVAQLKGKSYPKLSEQLQVAREKTQQQKVELGDENLDDTIAKLDADSLNDQTDNKLLDEGQTKVYKLAKIYYDEGNFQRAYDIIKKLEKQGLNDDLYIKTTWARLYCEILLKEPLAKKTLDRLKKKIEEAEEAEKDDLNVGEKETAQIQYSHRLYARKEEFLNLAIIVYFQDPSEEDFEKFVDLCTNKDYFAVVQLVCPHILKYLCVSYILNKTLHKNRQYDLFMLLEIIRRRVVKYSDLVVEFLEALNINYDFAEAAGKIDLLKDWALSDPLLAPLADKLIQNCYFMFYKVYCRVYEQVPLKKIAEFTGKSVEEAELWILGYIRSLDIEAKIDSVEGVVVASREEESLNEKYMDLLPKVRGFINSLKPSLN